jgi:hypothetical protein
VLHRHDIHHNVARHNDGIVLLNRAFFTFTSIFVLEVVMTSVVARLGLTKLSSTISSGGLTKGDTKGDKSHSGTFCTF